jgi:hypothetical protein
VTVSRSDSLIRDWRARFRKDPLASRVVADLRGRRDEIWRGTFELLQQESPEYRNSVDDEFTKESKSHCSELLKTIIAVAAGRAEKSGSDPFRIVRTHAEWRARHQVPLVASLYAYRLAHRTYWRMTREAVLRQDGRKEAIPSLTMLSDFWIEFFDHVGAVLAEAHAVEEGLIVAQGSRTYVGLIDDLLRGLAPREAEAQRLSALCGIRAGAPIAIAVARPLKRRAESPADVDVALRSLVRLIEQILPSPAFGRLVDIRNGEAMAIVCSESDTARGLADALRRNGLERRVPDRLAACVGVSMDTADIARLPDALEEARLALEFASPAQPLVHFSTIDLPEFLIRRAHSAAFRLIPEWADDFGSSGDEHASALARTIFAFADCSFNVKVTARRLGVHPNTVYFRLNRIKKLTGLDPRTYSGTCRLLTTLRLLDFRPDGGG